MSVSMQRAWTVGGRPARTVGRQAPTRPSSSSSSCRYTSPCAIARPYTLRARPPAPPPASSLRDEAAESIGRGAPAPADADRESTAGSAAAADGGPATPSGVPYTLIAGLTGVGAVETAYLTLTKLLHAPVACPTSGCETVLNSPYAYLFGVPLSALGCVAYAATCAAAASAPRAAPPARSGDAGVLDTGLLCAGTVLATTSAGLLFVLSELFEGETCLWCYGSATLSFATFAAVAFGLGPRRALSAAGPAAATLGLTALLLYKGFWNAALNAVPSEIPFYSPAVETESSGRAVELARRLRGAGAKMYGAFWCSHCFEQKEVFGAAAMADFPYVECFPDGWQRGKEVAGACQDAGVQAFPTWVIDGKVIEGEKTLDELESLLAQQ